MEHQLHCQGWFRIVVPSGWQSKTDHDCLSIYQDHPSSGVVQLSWYRSLLWEENLSARANRVLQETLSGLSQKNLIFTEQQRQGALWVSSGLFVAEELGEDLCRLWCVCDASTLLLVSYLGNPAAQQEQQDIETIVNSLRLSCD